jgi:hypothetical protein
MRFIRFWRNSYLPRWAAEQGDLLDRPPMLIEVRSQVILILTGHPTVLLEPAGFLVKGVERCSRLYSRFLHLPVEKQDNIAYNFLVQVPGNLFRK